MQYFQRVISDVRFLGVLALVLLSGFLLIANSPYMRYVQVGNSQLCSVRQLTNLPERPGFVAAGSSRVRRGVDIDTILANSGGAVTSGYNLGRPGRSMLRSYVILRDLVERGVRPDYFYLEVDLDQLVESPGKAVNPEPSGIGFSRFSDVVFYSEPLADDFPARMLFMASLVREKVTMSVISLFDGDFLRAVRLRKASPETVCWQNNFDVVNERRKAKKENAEGAHVPRIDGALAFSDDLASRLELNTYRGIREISRKNNIRLIVSRQKGYTETPLSASELQEIRSRIPEFIYPPEDVSSSLDNFFMDASHLGKEGREIYSKWLAGEIVRQ